MTAMRVPFIDTTHTPLYRAATLNGRHGRSTRRRSPQMRRAIAWSLLGLVFLGIPSTVQAQALGTIAGIVKDASDAVLPGVVVEASSPVLIEKTRSVTTDGR